MKSQVCCFVVLCFLATAMAGPLSVEVRERRSVTCPSCPPASPAPVPTGLPPYPNNCPNKPAGIVGLLQAVVYFLIHLILNLFKIISICVHRTGGLSLLTLIVKLIAQLEVCLVAIITASVTGDNAAITVQINLILKVVAQLIFTVDNILDDSVGANWCCQNPGGFIGDFVSGLISFLLNLGLLSLSAQVKICHGLIQAILSFCTVIRICISIAV